MSVPTTTVLDRHRIQFVEQFGLPVYESTIFAMLSFSRIAIDIAIAENDQRADTYMRMVARMILDMTESDPVL